MKKDFFLRMIFPLLAACTGLAACSTGPQVSRTLDVPDSADTPYENVLVIGLFERFDSRRRLENAVVDELSARGTRAIASTSMMDTKTPMTRETYLAMVDEHNPDALLVTHLVDITSKAALTESASPEATYKIRPTYYFNVWDVRLMEFKEPPVTELTSSLVLSTELYSVLKQDAVWAIESKSQIVQTGGPEANYLIFLDEGKAIVEHMSSDGLIAR
jgi:hypothetical protein